MKLTVLMENTACREGLCAVHGLSLYLESCGRSILVDVGPGDEFAENAKLLGVELGKVDFCTISHGHDDHGGGLGRFLRENGHAPVYLSKLAFEKYYAGKQEIGLDAALKTHPQIHLTGPLLRLDEQATLFSQVPGQELVPEANAGLRDADGPDPFLHEQDLLLEEDGRLFLFGGCAHRGIVNILERAREIAGRYPDVVVSGLHLAAGGTGRCMADDPYLDELAQRLLATGARFYSCHCTGPEGLRRLMARMDGRLSAISAGMVLEL